ncbi:MAG: hypothetical protein EOO20_12080, partial [Chryseobacterium sp.]
MKISRIKTILKAQTCNLFSREWYDKTALLLSEVDKPKEEIIPVIDTRFEKFQIGVKYLNSELSNISSSHPRTILKDLGKYCEKNGFVLLKTKS